MDMIIISMEDYIRQNGGYPDWGDSATHKNMTAYEKKTILPRLLAKDREIMKKRRILMDEYHVRVKQGLIKSPGRIEMLIRTAMGHPDNQSTQAAIRVLQKTYNRLSEQDLGMKLKIYDALQFIELERKYQDEHTQ